MDSEDKIHDRLEVMSKCDDEVLLKNTKEFKPIYLPMSLLKVITKNFYDGLQIGSGGFAVVYKGLLKRGGTIAVKKLLNTVCMDDNQFLKEVSCLMRVRHKNIVRFLGYCADTQGKMEDYKGKFVLADERERLLCFEYLPNGCLQKYINDASGGLEWNKRYEIIKGICEGLQYLHENNIVHLDLKPANILLNDNMVPKISDFGLSRCFEEMQSRAVTSTLIGSIGYLAPEFFVGEITRKLDIYSLGVIIAEMLTGQKGHSPVENVLECWRKRFGESYPGTDKVLEQVRVCANIRISCGNLDPAKRPDIQQITAILNQWSNSDEFPKIDNPTTMKSAEGFHVDDPFTNMHEMMPSHPDFEEQKTEESRAVGLVMDASFKNNDFEYLQIIKNEDLEDLRELCSDTFATVYHGKWRLSDVSITRIKESFFRGGSSEIEKLAHEFWREAEILSTLHHPNIVAFYGVVKDGPGGMLATVNEFMFHGSLRQVLQRKDKYLDRRKRLIIAMDAASGLEYLHSKYIVHFDLKCDNLLVNLSNQSRPICKVGDFGLSKIKRNTLASGGVRETLPWMAPELLNGNSNNVSEKVDVFSFGIVMWEILTGEEPYANMHYGAIIGGIINNTLRPPVPTSCEPEWRRLMEHCWAPDPAQRPGFTEIAGRLRSMSVAANQAKATK